MNLSSLAKRCVELSYRHKLTHVSSVLNTVDLLAEIYAKRRETEPVILGNGHAALALYVVLEYYLMCDAEKMILKHGVHPSRDMAHGIWCSSGSLGQAETVAVGMALADKTRKVWLITSDGAMMEGSAYEAMRFAGKYCSNLDVTVVFNGLGAYGAIEPFDLPQEVQNADCIRSVSQSRYPEWLRGLKGHYLTLTEEQYEELMA